MKYKILLIALLICNSADAQTKIGIEASCLATNTSVDVPGLIKDQGVRASSGFGYFLSFGASVQLGRRWALRLGPQFWKLAFSPKIYLDVYGGDDLIAKETGSLNYSGIYLRADCRWKYFFITGGFDISFHNSYSCDLVVTDKSGTVIEEQKGMKQSILTARFNNQFNILLGMGPCIPISSRLKLKGFLSGEIPWSSVYNSGIIVHQIYLPSGSQAPNAHVNVNYMPFFTYGLGVEYVFSKNE